MDSQTPQQEWLVAAGLAAKWLCALVFVSRIDPEQAKSLYIDPLFKPFNLDLAVEYDYSQRKVTATVFNTWSATAQMRKGLGAMLISDLEDERPLPEIDMPDVQDKPLPILSPAKLKQTFNQTSLDAALERAFKPEHNTLAVIVLNRGQLVAERYAKGIDANTPLPGFSMAKSITATLVGLLVKGRQLDINKPGIVPEWRKGSDGGDRVTLNHLLRMTSGLDLVEDQSGADPNSRMLFVESNKAAFTARCGLKHPPGMHWEYMSGSTVLACRAIFEAAGGTLERSQRFYRQALLAPLGAPSFVFETDAAGIFIGSTFALANAHDWAKFGQLYLQDGVWEGERLLPEGWVEYVRRHTPLSGENSYGAGFWTLEHSNLEGLPRDTFYANGFQGQYVLVVPSQDLVMVRLGASLGETGVWQLVGDLISAMRGKGGRTEGFLIGSSY
jgi:CubicO group peptidase (beta-lactamase class C family)